MRLAGEADWKGLIAVSGTQNDPYFSLLRRISAELGDPQGSPGWVVLASRLAAAQELALKKGLLKGSSQVAAALTSNGQALVTDALSGRPSQGFGLIGQSLKTANAFATYQQSVRGIARDALSNQA